MQAIHEQRELPRFTKEFIGKGHELEDRRRQRRKIQLEERSIANRVLFLEKEELRAEKALLKKRQELSRIVSIAGRQALEKQQKERMLLQRERQIQKTKEQNRLLRLMHKRSQQQSLQSTLQRNSLDYKIAKKMLQSGQKKKQLDRREDLTARRQRYMTLNLLKEQGRSRIDKYFKKKNKEHTKLYEDKISNQEEIARQKQNTIKKLTEIQEVLRKQLEQSSMRVSQMDQIIGDVTKSVKDRSFSRASHRQSASLYNQPTLITSIQGELLKNQEVDEKIEQGGEGGASEGGKVRKRRRNKHVNRYKQYEMF